MSITVTTRDGVCTLQLARPEKKNALTQAMYAQLADGLSAARRDAAVRAVAIRAIGPTFCAGNDMADFATPPDFGPEAPTRRFMSALQDCDLPVIACVNGAAVGIGATLLLHCDFVYLADTATLSMPFVHLGLVPEFASSLLLPRQCGRARASEALLLGRPIGAAEALAWGLASAVLPAAELEARAAATAATLARLPPEALRASKRLIQAALRDQVRDAIEREGLIFTERLRSDEARTAVASFLTRDRPGERRR